MLHYTRSGEGEPLILVHGFLGANEVFNSVMADLTAKYDVIAVDLPGHGQSKVEKDHYTVYDYASEVAAVLQKEGVSEATWLGHSLGGYVVLAAIERQITPVKRAILAYSSDLADTAEQKEKRTKQQQEIPEIGVEAFVDNIIAAFFREDASSELVDQARHIAYRATEEGLLVALDAMKARPDQHELLEQTQTPILILEGSQDKVLKPINTTNSNVKKVVTNTGHLGMLEEPQNFVDAIQEFML